jgi:phage shock protein PspC (stress-responsive transcriptional regulator)
MKTIMTIVAGIAIGYFIWQYIAGSKKGSVRGRIHKSATDKKLAGVCGGIAEWLGVDPVFIRLVWALLVLGWGTGVLLYIIFAIVLPEE